MVLELRPTWCMGDDAVAAAVVFGRWLDRSGSNVFKNDGDSWKPGHAFKIERSVELTLDPVALRRHFDLRAGASVGLGARWNCRATGLAGTHRGGPTPLDLASTAVLAIDIPSEVAGSVEIETCLVVSWAEGSRPTGSCPPGALIWSDGWSTPPSDRTVLLEGSEARIPVRSVSFTQQFGAPSGALWAIDVDPAAELDDRLSSVVTVLLNTEVLDRDFPVEGGGHDAALIAPPVLAALQSDLLRVLTVTLRGALAERDDWTDFDEGSVGAMLALHLTEAFGSVVSAVDNCDSDPSVFAREVWNRFAPNSWRSKT